MRHHELTGADVISGAAVTPDAVSIKTDYLEPGGLTSAGLYVQEMPVSVHALLLRFPLRSDLP
jgi:hypothetical protein